MTISAVPTHDQFMQPTLDALHALGGQATNVQIHAWVIGQLDLPDEVLELAHKPGSRLTEVEYRMMWTRTYLRQVGLIDSPTRATWLLTELGKQTTQINQNEIVSAVRQTYVKKNQEQKNDDEDLPMNAEWGETNDQRQLPPVPAAISLTPDYPEY